VRFTPRTSLGMGIFAGQRRPTERALRAMRMQKMLSARKDGTYCEDIADAVWAKLAELARERETVPA
jgi:hypothetical protein